MIDVIVATTPWRAVTAASDVDDFIEELLSIALLEETPWKECPAKERVCPAGEPVP